MGRGQGTATRQHAPTPPARSVAPAHAARPAAPTTTQPLANQVPEVPFVAHPIEGVSARSRHFGKFTFREIHDDARDHNLLIRPSKPTKNNRGLTITSDKLSHSGGYQFQSAIELDQDELVDFGKWLTAANRAIEHAPKGEFAQIPEWTGANGMTAQMAHNPDKPKSEAILRVSTPRDRVPPSKRNDTIVPVELTMAQTRALAHELAVVDSHLQTGPKTNGLTRALSQLHADAPHSVNAADFAPPGPPAAKEPPAERAPLAEQIFGSRQRAHVAPTPVVEPQGPVTSDGLPATVISSPSFEILEHPTKKGGDRQYRLHFSDGSTALTDYHSDYARALTRAPRTPEGERIKRIEYVEPPKAETPFTPFQIQAGREWVQRELSSRVRAGEIGDPATLSEDDLRQVLGRYFSGGLTIWKRQHNQ